MEGAKQFFLVPCSWAMFSFFLLMEIKMEGWRRRVRENIWKGHPLQFLQQLLRDRMG